MSADDAGRASDLADSLKAYFSARTDVVMAFLFGSVAKKRAVDESDVDVALYLRPVAADDRGPGGDRRAGELEIESAREFPAEKEIWRAIEEIVGCEVDLVILNRAPAALAADVFFEGIPIVISDRALYWRFFLTVTSEAEEFGRFAEDFSRVKSRSRSLSPTDRTRLLRSIDFVQEELEDLDEFQDAGRDDYIRDRSFRRNLERWVENLVNATIDIAKTVLASSRGRLPRTYRETVEGLGAIGAFDPAVCNELAEFTRLRNMLAHEYLDLRFSRIRDFVDHAPTLYAAFLKSAHGYLESSE